MEAKIGEVSCGVVGVLAAGPAFSMLSIDPAASAALRASATAAAGAGDSARSMPSFTTWLVDLVPANPIKAAADGAMLPLIIFAIAFGIAMTRIEAQRRLAVVRVFEGILDTSITLVRWVLQLAPIGVFALAVPLAARLGLSAAGALATYIVVVSVLSAVLIALLYPVAVIGGKISLATFARAALPAQAMAFSGRSRVTASHDHGHARHAEVAAADRRIPRAAPHGDVPDWGAMVPVLMAAGLPIEGAGIMLGVDTIPAMFRTTANATGDMTAAVVLGAREEHPAEA